MQQTHFLIGENGLLSESAASDLADWYVARAPGSDPIDFEAHLMLVRAFAALRTDSPFERGKGLTKARYNVLRMLHSDGADRMLMSDIVIGMNVSATNISKLVDGLERDGYVQRVDNDQDKRKVWVELLPAGKAVVEETLPEVADHISHLWKGLTVEEKRVLVHLLSKLRLHILTNSAGNPVEGIGTGNHVEGIGAGTPALV